MKLCLIIFSFCFSVLCYSQKSSDPKFNKLENQAFDLEDSGQLDSALAAYYGLLEYPGIDCQRIGREYNFIASVLLKQDKKEEALDILLKKVLPVWEGCDSLNRKYLVPPYEKLVKRYLVLKNPEKSIEYAHKIFDLYDKNNGKEPHRLITAHIQIAAAHSMQGDLILANRHLDLALYLSQTILNKNYGSYFRRTILQERIRISNDADDYTASIRYANEVLQMDNNPRAEFITRGNRLNAKVELGNIADSDEDVEWLSNNYDSITLSYDTKSLYHQYAAKYHLLKESPSQALERLKLAKVYADSTSDESNKATALSNMAIAYHQLKSYDRSADAMHRAIGYMTDTESLDILQNGIQLQSKKIYNYDDLLEILNDYLNIKKEQADITDSGMSIREVTAVFDEIDYLVKNSRNEYKSEFSQINQIEGIYHTYEEMIAWLVKNGNDSHIDKCLQYCMSNKSIVLKNKIAQKKNTLSNKKINELEAKANEIENRYLVAQEDTRDPLNEEYLRQLSHIYTLSRKIKDPIPKSTAPTKTAKENEIDDIKKSLKDDHLIIEIFYGTEDIYLFAISAGKTTVHIVNLSGDINQLIATCIDMLQKEGPIDTYKNKSKQVYDAVFRDLLSSYPSANKITIVADGQLHDLPLSTLWTGDKFLIQEYDINYLFSTNQELNTQNTTKNEYLGYGTSYSKDLNKKLSEEYSIPDLRLASLPNASDEITTCSRIADGRAYVGEQSSLANFLDQSENHSGIIHMALHGLILDQYNSAIIFDDRSDNFLLSSNDVYDLNLDNSLSILSACYSADGTIYSGEGVRSLSRAFHYAGSQNIISSQWAASDQANKRIMNDFFTYIDDGADYTHALNKAQRNYLNTASPAMSHPSNWGNLILMGHGQKSTSISDLLMIGFAGVIGLFFLFLLLKYMRKRSR